MKPRIVPMFFFVLASIVCLAPGLANQGDVNDGWKLATERNGVTIYSRPHAGSSLKEFKAVGEIAAPSRAVCDVIEDVDAYPSFMPYMAECRVRRRNQALCGSSYAKGLGCSSRTAPTERALLIRSTQTRAELFQRSSPIILARAGLWRFSPQCANR